MNRIIYKNNDNTISVVIPSIEALALYSVEEIAIKDVPNGLPYKIVDISDVPSDRDNRDLWIWNEHVTPDGVGGISNKFGGN